jgi:exopolysaccharide biosynthesis polyprenyl glycosylphosphotransferase
MADWRAATIPDVAEDEASEIRSLQLSAATTGLPVRGRRPRGSNGRPADKRLYIGGYRLRVVLTDVLIVVTTILLVSIARFGIDDPARLASSTPALAISYQLVAVFTAVVWACWLLMHGCWSAEVPGDGLTEVKRIVRASASLFAVVVTINYLLSLNLARGFLLVALPVGTFAMVVARLSWRGWLRRRRRRGIELTDMLVIGGRTSAVALSVQLSRATDSGYRIVGLCIPRPDDAKRHTETGPHPVPPPKAALDGHEDSRLAGFPVLGDLDDVLRAIDLSGASVVAVAASDRFGADAVRNLSWALEGSGVRLMLAPAVTEVSPPRVRLRPVAGLALVQVVQPRFRGPSLVGKTAMDLTLALLATILFLPLMAIVALCIKFDDRGPVLFSQERIGLRGRTFRIWKFRSMAIDAESRRAELQAQSEGNEVLFKLRSDPRVTRVGKILRRYSLDELPQLFNVLTGDMSLVGPRPPLQSEVANYTDAVHRRLLVKPGMTGLWQVSGRSNLSWQESVRLDLFYVENWSPAGDLAIMAQTVKVMLSPNGAY